MGERDFIALIDGAHQLLKSPIVLVRDRLNAHVSPAMRELIVERAWRTVFLLSAYAPDVDSGEWVWARVKRSLANLAAVALVPLEALVRNRPSACNSGPALSTASQPAPAWPSSI